MSGHEHHHAPTRRARRSTPDTSCRDAEAAPVLKFLAFLAVVTVGVAALVIVFYNYLESREARREGRRATRWPRGSARPMPPPPRLQTYPFQDVKDLRQEERRLLETYEWVDRNAGVVRIPVDRAIEVLAEKGLPYRKPGEAAAPPAAPPADGAAPRPAPQPVHRRAAEVVGDG